MASARLLFLILMLSSVTFKTSAQRLLELECQPAAGFAGKETKISCSFKTVIGDKDITISGLVITKNGQKDVFFSWLDNVNKGDPRVKLSSRTDPSLLFTNTTVSDEGEYEYKIMTNRGMIKDGRFSLRVTARYSDPVTSWSDGIKEGGSAELYCRASGGYPEGAIHWFDTTGTNWTKNAKLDITETSDKLLTMSSTLTFTSIDLSWATFRCVVLNGKFVKEGEQTFKPIAKDAPADAVSGDKKNLTNTQIIAPVVVIGSLIVGLLFTLIIFRRRRSNHYPGNGTENHYTEVEQGHTANPTQNGEVIKIKP
ncbi:ICOS ligand-like isoform X2 [Hoplias malabaricus]|uniref:ICOS ligand-like isoform X2 n=1 Tax=Hoplias malabaricus TaxID=27720 RepID=UPI0034625DFE